MITATVDATVEKPSVSDAFDDEAYSVAEREIQRLISARVNFDPDNYEDPWAVEEVLRAHIREYSSR